MSSRQASSEVLPNLQTGRNLSFSYSTFHEPALSDPYSLFAVAREAGPAFWAEELGVWVITRREDIYKILDDEATFSAVQATAPFQELSQDAQDILREVGFRGSCFSSDGPYHHRMRRHVAKAFTPRRIASLRPFIEEQVSSTIDRMESARHGDLVAELFGPLPARVILHLLGVAEPDVDRIIAGSRDRIAMIFGRLSDDEQVEVARKVADFWTYVRKMVDDREAHPVDDLASDLIRIRDGDDSILSLEEITSVLVSFFSAGFETTTALLSNMLYHLLDQREAWEAICNDQSLIPNTIEEMLRYDTSIFAWRRRVVREVVIGDCHMKPGDTTLILLGAANHEEEWFASPNTFDILRENAKDHASFGHGRHYCVGAALARLEVLVTVEQLSTRMPSLSLDLDKKISYLPNISLRTPLSLWLQWDLRGRVAS